MSITSRRTFMKASAATTAAVALSAGRLAARPLGLPIGLQLYSVREMLPKDLDGTLAKVASAGYKEVEAAGYFGHPAAEIRHAMDQAGLRCVSTHHVLSELRVHLDEFIEYGHAVGVEYIICPSGMSKDPAIKNGPKTLDDWRWMAEEFNRIGEKVKAAGMTLGYHNHDQEWESENGVIFYDELLRLTDPKFVCFEMDCGWVVSAGRNPVDYLSKTPARFPLLHVKDMVKGENGRFHSTVMGHGVIDYRPILRAATGLKHYFVEQEEFDMDVMQALRLDAEYMRKLDV
jgi:sugar phosphate isomerase/epimerase